jgi:hypothetical protein
MTKQKNPTSFYRRGTSNNKFGYYAEGNYSIVKPLTQSYYGFLTGVIGVTSTKTNNTTNNTTQHVKTNVKTINKMNFKN